MNTRDNPQLIRPDINYHLDDDAEHRKLEFVEADGDVTLHAHHTVKGDVAISVVKNGEEEVAITIGSEGDLNIIS